MPNSSDVHVIDGLDENEPGQPLVDVDGAGEAIDFDEEEGEKPPVAPESKDSAEAQPSPQQVADKIEELSQCAPLKVGKIGEETKNLRMLIFESAEIATFVLNCLKKLPDYNYQKGTVQPCHLGFFFYINKGQESCILAHQGLVPDFDPQAMPARKKTIHEELTELAENNIDALNARSGPDEETPLMAILRRFATEKIEITKDDLNAIEKILKKDGFNLLLGDRTNQTLLHRVIHDGQFSVARKIMEAANSREEWEAVWSANGSQKKKPYQGLAHLTVDLCSEENLRHRQVFLQWVLNKNFDQSQELDSLNDFIKEYLNFLSTNRDNGTKEIIHLISVLQSSFKIGKECGAFGSALQEQVCDLLSDEEKFLNALLSMGLLSATEGNWVDVDDIFSKMTELQKMGRTLTIDFSKQMLNVFLKHQENYTPFQNMALFLWCSISKNPEENIKSSGACIQLSSLSVDQKKHLIQFAQDIYNKNTQQKAAGGLEEKSDSDIAAQWTKTEAEWQGIEEKINRHYFAGKKECTSYYQGEQFVLRFDSLDKALHVRRELKKLMPAHLDLVDVSQSMNGNDCDLRITKLQWDAVKDKVVTAYFAPVPVPDRSLLLSTRLSSLSAESGVVGGSQVGSHHRVTPPRDMGGAPQAAAIPMPAFDYPGQAVVALNYLCSHECIGSKIHTKKKAQDIQRYRFYFKTREQAEKVCSFLLKKFGNLHKWEGFRNGRILDSLDYAGSCFFTLTKEQWQQVCAAVIRDVHEKITAVDALLEQNKLNYSASVAHVKTQLDPLSLKITLGQSILIQEAETFQTAMRNLPMPPKLKAAIAVLVLGLLTCAFLAAGGAVPAAAIGCAKAVKVVTGLSGAYTVYGLFRHCQDQSQLRQAVAIEEPKQPDQRPRQAASASS